MFLFLIAVYSYCTCLNTLIHTHTHITSTVISTLFLSFLQNLGRKENFLSYLFFHTRVWNLYLEMLRHFHFVFFSSVYLSLFSYFKVEGSPWNSLLLPAENDKKSRICSSLLPTLCMCEQQDAVLFFIIDSLAATEC